MEDREIIIIAPHPDDEIIGCYSILKSSKVYPIVIYTSELPEHRLKETQKLASHFKIRDQLYLTQIPDKYIKKENIFYFPDPIYETHPDHRVQGSVGELMARSGYNVMFYSTNMQAPYIHEINASSKKKKALNDIYPGQKSLWEFDHKYFLFEGYCKWFF